MNKHIELVKKWLANNDSVSSEELKANKEGAYAAKAANPEADFAAYYCAAAMAAAAAYYDYDAAMAAAAAYYDYDAADAHVANAADVAAYWVKRYEELTK